MSYVRGHYRRPRYRGVGVGMTAILALTMVAILGLAVWLCRVP